MWHSRTRRPSTGLAHPRPTTRRASQPAAAEVHSSRPAPAPLTPLHRRPYPPAAKSCPAPSLPCKPHRARAARKRWGRRGRKRTGSAEGVPRVPPRGPTRGSARGVDAMRAAGRCSSARPAPPPKLFGPRRAQPDPRPSASKTLLLPSAARASPAHPFGAPAPSESPHRSQAPRPACPRHPRAWNVAGGVGLARRRPSLAPHGPSRDPAPCYLRCRCCWYPTPAYPSLDWPTLCRAASESP
mmetsp:Transcript_68970/g.197828  ORF Transcript_68970/g.197828 Transcript_68970/m.197828 type:complete len:241 (+) Transcript_68970:745-1467(+)